MAKVDKSSVTSKFLALGFIIVILSGFLLVAVVAEYHDRTSVEEAFATSDGSRFLGNFTENGETVVSTGELWSEGGVVDGEEFTPIYLGNNTWGANTNGVEANDTTFYGLAIRFPNADRYLLTKITYELYVPDDSVTTVRFYLLCLDRDLEYTSSAQNRPYLSGRGGLTTGWNNRTVEVTLYNALNSLSIAKNYQDAYLVVMFDAEGEALSPGIFQFNVKAYGEHQKTFTTEGAITLALLASDGMLIIAIPFATRAVNVSTFTGAAKKAVGKAKRRGG